MGRRTGDAYQVKNTFVELAPNAEDTEFSRSRRTMSANDAENQPMCMPDDNFMAKTPSPFLHPSLPPNTAFMPPLEGYDLPSNGMDIAFGDFGLAGLDENGHGDMNNYTQGMMYDPSSGMYMAYDWNMAYNQGCYPMMGDMQGGIGDEYQLNGFMPMQPHVSSGHTESLLAALSEKLGKGSAEDDNGLYDGTGFDENGLAPDAMGAIYGDNQAYMDPTSEIFPVMEMAGSTISGGAHHDHGQQGERSGRKNRNRDRGDRGDRSERNEGGDRAEAGMENQAAQHQGPCNFTTVMFRNIPNKYTREMLVKQLEQDLKGHFDFVYLPIDFKNKCNVGYAFINFRSIPACETFLNNFNGVEVRKCLPGLNSRKVTEVTPARVQGFEENVQRLRNSPVMRELAHHAEWMPLIFDANGDQTPFPTPERPLEPIKPRRRGREDSSKYE